MDKGSSSWPPYVFLKFEYKNWEDITLSKEVGSDESPFSPLVQSVSAVLFQKNHWDVHMYECEKLAMAECSIDLIHNILLNNTILVSRPMFTDCLIREPVEISLHVCNIISADIGNPSSTS
jgi:hypothetical protein